MNINQAWDYLNGYTLTWLPPISNANPYHAETGRTIPVEFTVKDQQGNFVIDNSASLEVLDANGNPVIGLIRLSDNPTQGISLQDEKYHYNLNTSRLPEGSYTVKISYNSINSQQPATWVIQLTTKKK